MKALIVIACGLAAVILAGAAERASAKDPEFRMNPGVSRDEVLLRTLKPYDGTSKAGMDVSTLKGKVMCGYQGWFTCPSDSSGRGWHHWAGRGGFEPGRCSIDLWPDVSDLPKTLRYPTSFRLADGSPAEVFSPLDAATVDKHFEWMETYGIDGAFMQRFVGEVSNPMGLYHFNTVLANARAGANRHGRAYAVMYDLSGLPKGGTRRVMDDWKALIDRMRIGKDPKDKAYLRHRGKPVVALWGVGFSGDRKYTLEECEQLIEWLKNDLRYGGFTVMVGVPAYWRTLNRDAVADPRLHEVIAKADIISPWMVGRFGSPNDVPGVAAKVWKPDGEWCRERKLDYLPVVFPGFSWHNMRPQSKLGQIPRLGGRFLWKQYVEAAGAGATMVYQAMFDEVDEATAIFKCTNNPPVGESKFLTYEGLPTDHYLWLVGQGGKLIRGEIKPTADLPVRTPSPNSTKP